MAQSQRVEQSVDLSLRHEGDLVVAAGGHLRVLGVVVGDVEVERDGRLKVRGLVTGNVQVRSGGRAEVTGTVNGRVTVEPRGALTVAGVVTVAVEEAEGARVRWRPGAVVAGERRES
jgi:cytoskeletal protein CcmA (bactofilin family)